MFDTYVQRVSGTSFPSRIDVHEHKAPTSESARLLSELEREAEKRLMSLTKLDDNVFNVTWYVFDSPMTLSLKAVGKFLINGQEHKIEIDIPTRFIGRKAKVEDYKKFGDEVCKAIQEKVAKFLTIELFNQHTCKIIESLEGKTNA